MVDKMKELLKKKDMCVLATCMGNRPHCSLMAYLTDEAGECVYLVTLKSTQKYRNLLENPEVSLLLDTRSEHGDSREGIQALTVSGTCTLVSEKAHREFIRRRFMEKHAHLSRLLNDPELALLRVRIESFLLLQGPLDAHFEKL